jgi:ATP-binding cassette subfamily F protein 3
MEKDHSLLERYGQLQTRFDTLGGYDYSHRIETVLTGLAFDKEMWDRPISTFSGGQRSRAHIARLLLEEPDLLLLDEPTNHLDLDSVEWMERWLEAYKGSVVVVSHDRYFLDHVTKSTWEVAGSGLEAYRGNYTQFLPKRQVRYEERLSQWTAQQKYIEETQEFIRRFLAGQRTKEAQGRRTRLERFIKTEAIPQPTLPPVIHVKLSPRRRSGDLVLRAENLAIGYAPQTPLLKVDSLEIRRKQRIAIVGANGIGKTTLLKTLGEMLASLEGEVSQGANVDIGYLSQTHEELHPEMTVLNSLMKTHPGLKTQQALEILGALLLGGESANKRISELSGGQRSRVLLSQIVAQDANLLLLDEPTNHLDIASQEVLQEVLMEFDGTILFVSHDRYLIDALATDLWIIDQKTVKTVVGNWEAYLRWRSDANTSDASAPPDNPEKTNRKEAYRDRRKRQNELQKITRRLEQVEQRIAQIEALLVKLHDDISLAGEQGDMKRIEKLGNDYQRHEVDLKSLMEEWEQLSHEMENESD